MNNIRVWIKSGAVTFPQVSAVKLFVLQVMLSKTSRNPSSQWNGSKRYILLLNSLTIVTVQEYDLFVRVTCTYRARNAAAVAYPQFETSILARGPKTERRSEPPFNRARTASSQLERSRRRIDADVIWAAVVNLSSSSSSAAAAPRRNQFIPVSDGSLFPPTPIWGAK